MPRNLELKARIKNLEKIHASARALGARSEGILHHVDTYFHIERGRLKLREIKGSHSELIHYFRDEPTHERVSEYEIVPLMENVTSLKEMLANSLGVRAVVEKTRALYLLDRTRIHVDEVMDLGNFLEFEIPLLRGQDDAVLTMKYLIKHFSLQEDDFIGGSYVDLVTSRES